MTALLGDPVHNILRVGMLYNLKNMQQPELHCGAPAFCLGSSVAYNHE